MLEFGRQIFKLLRLMKAHICKSYDNVCSLEWPGLIHIFSVAAFTIQEWRQIHTRTVFFSTGDPDTFSARFDFSGQLMPFRSEDIPVRTSGLHHHGEEPDRPGYTLEELLTLARSTYPQQRCLAFDTLTNVIDNHKQGR